MEENSKRIDNDYRLANKLLTQVLGNVKKIEQENEVLRLILIQNKSRMKKLYILFLILAIVQIGLLANYFLK